MPPALSCVSLRFFPAFPLPGVAIAMVILTSILISFTAVSAETVSQPEVRKAAIAVRIPAREAITLTADELAKLDRTKVESQHHGHGMYEGACIATILQVAGVNWGPKPSIRQDCYVVIEAADGYRAVFSVPEIDPRLANRVVILADRCDGEPLSKEAGPYQVIEQDAKHCGRCVRQVTAIHVCKVSEQATTQNDLRGAK